MSELRCQEFTKCGVWNLMFDGHLLKRSAACVCVFVYCKYSWRYAVLASEYLKRHGVSHFKNKCNEAVS